MKFVRSNWLQIFTIFILLLAITLIIFNVRENLLRHRQFPLPLHNPAKLIELMEEELSLTYEQKAKLEIIATDIKAYRDESFMKKDPESRKNALAEIIRSDSLSRSTIQAHLDSTKHDFQAMDEFIIGKMMMIHELLTPEQREIIAQKVLSFNPPEHK
ncbi:MAG: Spy/CpxP family protein refolding chaperone [Candidatus Cloacimonetes bacterium]|nr:Spy/CpxP family protein refolding chaperone [Candidatus Cloacimonadota bacterium]